MSSGGLHGEFLKKNKKERIWNNVLSMPPFQSSGHTAFMQEGWGTPAYLFILQDKINPSLLLRIRSDNL
jgi:hypothetical protein